MLDPLKLLAAYKSGIFPMAVDPEGTIGWFAPDPRALIPLDDRFHVSHGLKRTLNKKVFEVQFDRRFEEVIRACSVSHGDTWISEDIIESYLALHRMGNAHSVEVLVDGELAGGLYGVGIAGAFFGESMFHRVTDASKVALVALVERLRERGFELLDTQWSTTHLEQFGTYTIPREDYMVQLHDALRVDAKF